MYRNQSRFGDPMAAYVKKRQSDEPPPIALPGGKRKKSGAPPPTLAALDRIGTPAHLRAGKQACHAAVLAALLLMTGYCGGSVYTVPHR